MSLNLLLIFIIINVLFELLIFIWLIDFYLIILCFI